MANIAKIFVIIVTYKGHLWYERCFTSLRNSEYPVQTIVIDNASNDGTAEYTREHFPEIHLIESKENLGFGRANNIGMRYALDNGCDYVFLLNQDAWIEPNTIGELVRIAEKHPEYGVFSPLQINKEKNNIEKGLLSIITHHRDICQTILSDTLFYKLRELYEVPYINAACWLIPIRTIEMIGGFCPIIYHYGEDDDYLNRLKFHKYKIGLCPHVRVVHDTERRVDNSSVLFSKANEINIDELLNINYEIDLKKIQRSYWKNIIKNLVRLKIDNVRLFYKKYSFVKHHQLEIENCRKTNKLKKQNWL